MDEAVVRIVLDDSGEASPAPPPANSPAPPAIYPGNNRPSPNQAPLRPPAPAPISSPLIPPPTVTPPKLVDPIPVKVKEAPKSDPPPAAPPTPSRDWMRDLVDGIAGANRHVLVEGESGSGKSSLTRSIAFERAKKGEEVNVLDPHKPETWKGVNKVYARDAAADFAESMMDRLRKRETASVDAASRGEKIEFEPVTFALSDFAAIAKDFPKLKDVMQTVLTEGRKFNIAVLAETAGFNAEEIGAGTVAMRRNFKQKIEMFAPGPGEPDRTAKMGKDVFKTPDLSAAADTNKDRFDPSIVQYKSTAPPEPPPIEEPFDPLAMAKKRVESEERRAAVEAEYAKLKPPPPVTLKAAFDPVEVARERVEREEQHAAAEAEYAKLKPPPPLKVKSGLDNLLEAAESLRGSLSGTFGKVVGATLDITAKLRELRAKADAANIAAGRTGLQSRPPDIPYLKPAVPSAPSAIPVAASPALTTPTTTPTKPETAASEIASKFQVPEAAPGAWQDKPTTKPTNPFADLAQAPPQPAQVPTVQPPIAQPVQPPAEMAALGDAAGAVGSKLASMGPIVAAAAVAFVAITGAIDAAVQRYGELSQQGAQAQATVEINKTMNDLRRGQEHGAELARYIESQGRMQEKWEEAKMKLLMKVAPTIESIFEVLEVIGTVVGTAVDVATFIPDQLGKLVKSTGELLGIKRDEKLKDKDGEIADPTSKLYKGNAGIELSEV